jgi:putative transposase
MSRLARLVVPGLPHLVTQRGNGGQRVFFSDADYVLYRDLLIESCEDAGVACWAHVLMPTHVHLILVPSDPDGLRAALAPVHRRYAGLINARRRRRGHFWQGRFGAVVLDEEHLAAALAYVMLNPVRARLALRPDAWKWSSARAYLRGLGDGLTETKPVLARFPGMARLLKEGADETLIARLRAAETIGRPLGNAKFIKRLETRTGRRLAPQKRGPKPRGGT